LLQDDRFDPSLYENAAIGFACRKGNIAVVNRLLQDKRVDPSDVINHAIRIAIEKGYVEVVDRLLQDDRVDPFAEDYHYGDYREISCASRDGYIAVVDRLLQELTKCVEPTSLIKEVLKSSSYRGHADIVYLILQNKQVNDCYLDINWAIWIVTMYGRTNIVNLLLQHKARNDVKNLTVEHHEQNYQSID
jgi:ankyrin repeat protein